MIWLITELKFEGSCLPENCGGQEPVERLLAHWDAKSMCSHELLASLKWMARWGNLFKYANLREVLLLFEKTDSSEYFRRSWLAHL